MADLSHWIKILFCGFILANEKADKNENHNHNRDNSSVGKSNPVSACRTRSWSTFKRGLEPSGKGNEH